MEQNSIYGKQSSYFNAQTIFTINWELIENRELIENYVSELQRIVFYVR